jgi:hypothetical protein
MADSVGHGLTMDSNDGSFSQADSAHGRRDGVRWLRVGGLEGI